MQPSIYCQANHRQQLILIPALTVPFAHLEDNIFMKRQEKQFPIDREPLFFVEAADHGDVLR